MTVSFSRGDLHLPNGQAEELLKAIGYSEPIVATHGSMSVAHAKRGVVFAKLYVKEGTALQANLAELEEVLNDLESNGIEILEWS